MSDTKKACKTGFFTALAGCFTRPEIFHQLRFQSAWRTFFHLVFFSLLLAVWTAAAQYAAGAGAISSAVTAIGESFGKIIFSESGARPEIEPDRGRLVPLFDRTYLLYYPEKGMKVLLPSDAETLVVWLPEQFMFGRKMAGGKDWVIGFTEAHEVAGDGLELFLDSQFEKSSVVKFPAQTLSPEMLGANIKAGFIFGTLIVFWLRYLGMSLLLSSMFCLFFMWTRRSAGLNFRQAWVISIYSGMPGLFIGSFFPALNLPLLTDNLVYVIVLVIYFPLIAAKEEQRNE